MNIPLTINDSISNYTGWWCNFTILKNDGVKVNGKDDIPYINHGK